MDVKKTELERFAKVCPFCGHMLGFTTRASEARSDAPCKNCEGINDDPVDRHIEQLSKEKKRGQLKDEIFPCIKCGALDCRCITITSCTSSGCTLSPRQNCCMSYTDAVLAARMEKAGDLDRAVSFARERRDYWNASDPNCPRHRPHARIHCTCPGGFMDPAKSFKFGLAFVNDEVEHGEGFEEE